MPFTKVVYGNTHFYDAERCQSNTPSALNRIIVIGSDKLLISTDDGNSFSDLLYTSIPNFPIPTSNLGNYSFLQVDHGGIEVSNIQNNNNAIFIQLFVRYSLSGNDDILNYVFLQSTDGGATFQIMSFPTTPSTIQAHNSAVFKVAPNNPNRWYLEQTGDATVCGGGNERKIEQSNTQGDVWVSLNNMNTHGDQRALEFVSSNLNNDVLIAGNDGGVSIFENAVWTNINGNGLNISRVNNITSLEKKHESLLLGQQDGNIDFYNNGFWTNLFGGDKFKGILELNNNNAIMSKGLVNYEITGSIFKNFQGQTIPRPTRRFLGFPIYKIFNTNNEYYAMRDNFTGTGKETLSIYHSIDGGVEWNAISNANYATKPIGSANSIIISDDGNSIYYTIGGARWFQNSNVFTQNDDAGIYKITRNSNNTWQTSATNLTNNLYIKDGNPPITEYNSNFTTHNVSPLANYHSLTGVMLNPENSNELWVTLGGANKWYNTNSILSTHKVYKSVNGGSTWIDCSKGLPAVSVNCIVYQRNSGGRIFVGTDIGVFYIDNSNDNTWKYYGNNQVGVQIKELEINYCSQRIYAATWGRGVWYAPIHPRITHYSVGVNNLISASEVFNPAGDILIESGAKLTIRGALKMNRNKKITIQPGGILFVDGGSIKGNKCTEDVFWEGIEMIGEANISQPNFSTLYDFGLRQLNNIWTSQQPLCVFKNASVEDARTAVHVGKIIDGTTSYLYSGGIVIGDGATFRNNHRVAEFVQYNYRDPNNPASSAIYQSVFTNCILYGKIIKTLHRKLWLLIGGQWG